LKKNTLLSGLAALAIAVTLCLCPSALHAQTQQQQPAAHAQPMPHSFTGVLVALKNGHYALVMGRGPKGQPMGHMLDHANNAKKYVGKEVKVTGNLNMSNNTVEVSSIQRK
jgi:hypothetical protein